jgi:SAM-dependent methyltransferase
VTRTDFDHFAGDYEAELAAATAFAGADPIVYTKAKADLLLETVRAHFGTAQVTALDVGCGPGHIHSMLAPHLRALHGCDPATALLEEARQANPGVVYAALEGGTLPYDDDAFDLAFTICVLHHVPPAERPAFVGQLARVVRPGGLVAVIEHNRLNPGTRRVVDTCSFDEDAVLLAGRETRRRLRSAGLHSIRTRYFLLAPWRNPVVRAVERVTGRLPLGAQYLTTARV